MRSKRLKATEVITLQKKLDLMIKFINDCKNYLMQKQNNNSFLKLI